MDRFVSFAAFHQHRKILCAIGTSIRRKERWGKGENLANKDTDRPNHVENRSEVVWAEGLEGKKGCGTVSSWVRPQADRADGPWRITDFPRHMEDSCGGQRRIKMVWSMGASLAVSSIPAQSESQRRFTKQDMLCEITPPSRPLHPPF